MTYKLLVEEAALERLLGMAAAQRLTLLKAVAALADAPSQHGDFEFLDSSFRTIQVKYAKGFMLTYWADHATKELRVVAIEKV